MADELPYLLTTVAAARVASIHKHLLCKSAAAAAAAIPHAFLPFVLLSLRMGVLAPQKTCCMTVTKVRVYLNNWFMACFCSAVLSLCLNQIFDFILFCRVGVN